MKRDSKHSMIIKNDYQEHSPQTDREITDRYLESQNEVIKSFQST
ncbi:MAG: hypothetical protein WCC17_07390 [Candidatus Nitrosopolaris sp.]